MINSKTRDLEAISRYCERYRRDMFLRWMAVGVGLLAGVVFVLG